VAADPADPASLRILLAGEASRVQPGTAMLHLIVRDLEGRRIVGGEQALGELAGSSTRFATHVAVPPGSYMVRLAIQDGAGRVGSVDRMVEARPVSLGPIAVTGPTGGVGAIAISLFKAAGFQVAAITGKPSEAAFLRELGADEIVDRNTLDMGSKPLETARWGGAVDNLGGDTLAYLTRTVKPWGSIGAIGLAQSPTLNTTVVPFILRGVSLLGIWSVEGPRAWRLSIWDRLSSDWKPKGLTTLIAPRLISLDEVPAVCADMIAGKTKGRVVVKIGGE
jgi:NADPH:quinone reductase-like Zn-dependent oxidoreductase